MRKYTIKKLLPLLGLITSVMAFGQSGSENYVQSKTCLNEDCSRVSETVTYFDGLGRPKQVVSVKSTPAGKDLVTAVTYDGFGRKVKDILPVPAATQNSGIHPGITDESAANSHYGVSNAFSEKQLENSPLDRVLQQAHPGEAWKMSAGKTQQFSYDANSGNEVKKFLTVTSPNTSNNVSTGISVLSVSAENSGFYPASTLYKNTVTDEDGNPVTEFTNGRGQTLLIRRNDGSGNVDTYYVYNEYNQLAYVLSPKAVQQITQNNDVITEAILNELCYQYRYDGRDRLVEKRLPGKDWEWMVYDKQDRLVLSQDANLRTATNSFNAKGWLFTKYDELGRVAYTGFFSNTANRQVMQNALNSMAANPYNNEKRSRIPFTSLGIDVYYDKKGFPTGSMTILSINYYDTYPQEAPLVSATVLGQHTLPSVMENNDEASTNGLLTASYVRNIEDNAWTNSYRYYDSRGRGISTYSINHLGGRTWTESKLDFAGVVQQTVTRHKRLNTDTDKIITENFTYDNQNRLLSHSHQMDNSPVEYLAQNTYNDLSQLINKKVGDDLQSIDYAYNIRGWLTRVNDPSNLNGKLFGYEIKYNNPQDPDYGIARFNGNISEVDWKTQLGDGNYRRYAYKYDPLNRLTDGIYLTPLLASNTQNHYYDEKLSYDMNGNIKTLNRFKNPPSGLNIPQHIDELSYEYDASGNSNKLVRVKDAKANSFGYPSGGNPIGYDGNGNMTSHVDKGISSLQYNFLNLPRQVISSQGNTSYIYRADGVKVKKVFGSTVTDYLGGFQYENGILKFLPTSEGFYNAERSEYAYNYTDHLGNIRLSYSEADGGGIAVLEENNYYPFGLKHQGYNDGSTLSDYGTNYKYKYNGKELQETGMYDYGARFYMPDIGRWGVVDPLAEVSRRWAPYVYAYNNPISFIDPDGMLSVNSLQQMWNNTSSSSSWTNNGDGTFEGGEDDPKKKNSINKGRRMNDSDRRTTTKDNTGDYTKSELNYIESKYKSFISKARKRGYNFSADNLERFLKNLPNGSSINVNSKFLLNYHPVKSLVDTNSSKIWLAVYSEASNLKVGQSINITKNYRDSNSANFGTDLYFGSGGFNINTVMNVKATRTGELSWSFSGTVTNNWNDTYNWNTGQGVYIPSVGMIPDQWGQALEDNNRANSYQMNSSWSTNIDKNIYGVLGVLQFNY